jgi:hypothetical protein
MRHVVLRLVIILFLLVTTMPPAFPQDPSHVQPPRVPKEGDVDVPYWGTLTEVTKNSITIQWTATKGEKPKTFIVSETLASGKIPMEPRLKPDNHRSYRVSPIVMYRLSDVKVGDWVDIYYAHVGGVDICDHICIKKRPGGRVPPLPEEAEALRKPPPFPGDPNAKLIEAKHIRYDEWTNAYWDLEDRGIPYPEQFGKNRRFPIAPMPRLTSVTTPRTDN